MCFNLKLSVNEIYYTIFEILLVKNMLCSKLHYQKGFNLNLFSYKILAPASNAPPGCPREQVWGGGVRFHGSGVRIRDDNLLLLLVLALPTSPATRLTYEMCFNLKLSGNEIYNTNTLTLLVKNMLCSKLHYQNVFKLKLW